MLPLKKDIKLVRSLHQKKFRNEFGLFLVEGKKMVEEALNSSFELHSLYTTDNNLENKLAQKVTSKEMEMMSALNSPSSYLAVLQQKPTAFKPSAHMGHTVMVLDGMADPGNLGTIMRTAEWFGIQTIFHTEDGVEIYNPKTVQATMGSVFRVDVQMGSTTDIIHYLKSNSYQFVGADLKGQSIYEYPFAGKEAIVIGSESHGIRKDMRDAIDTFINIPGHGQAESLNASIATSIVLSEMFRKKIK